MGDIFLVENKDQLCTVGQIVGQERAVLNSVSCAFFDFRVQRRCDRGSLEAQPFGEPFAVLFVTRELLDSGVWILVGHRATEIRSDQQPYEQLREREFVGAKVIGAGIVGQFLDAYFGLAPWDDWKDPKYLDGLLISPNKKPRSLVFRAGRDLS